MDAVPGEAAKSNICDFEENLPEDGASLQNPALTLPSTSKRSRKRRLDLNSCFSVSNFICSESYCGLTLPDEESLDQHYKQHLEQELGKLTKLRIKKKALVSSDELLVRNTRNTAFEKLKLRREIRNRRVISGSATASSSGVLSDCPVCGIVIEGSREDLKEHFAACLRVKQSYSAEEDFIEVDDEDYEEYEWAGQKRIRSTSMFKGGLKAAGFLTIKQTREDEVLDIVGYGEEEIGTAQYNDSDLLRIEDEVLDSSSDTSDTDHTESTSQTGNLGDPYGPSTSSSSQYKDTMCKICMSSYDSPLTSTACWHVHCEKCWLLALGAKKLCPQCKAIVTPGDLRRIYL
eukprot:GFUD01018149.1.p1 GENE.GFUD01018149.1~~GFUD01018149.1.p1  ORF type:complete len:346 (+),score=76.11 GFUD01018149.1:97-1134(+)